MHIMENISIIGGEFIMLKDLFKKAAAVLVSAASVFALGVYIIISSPFAFI